MTKFFMLATAIDPRTVSRYSMPKDHLALKEDRFGVELGKKYSMDFCGAQKFFN